MMQTATEDDLEHFTPKRRFLVDRQEQRNGYLSTLGNVSISIVLVLCIVFLATIIVNKDEYNVSAQDRQEVEKV